MTHSGGWRLFGLPLLVVTALILPVALLGLAFEDRVTEWVSSDWPATTRFWIIVAALSGDILLPIPSSGVSTYAGGTLGADWGSLASWIGMSLGAIIGFGLARLLGRPFAQKQGGDDVRVLEKFSSGYGTAALVVTRPLPLLAEACVLMAGASQMTWRQFLPPVLVSNMVISITYAAAGAFFKERDALPLAVITSVLVPLTVAVMVRRRWRNTPKATDPSSVQHGDLN